MLPKSKGFLANTLLPGQAYGCFQKICDLEPLKERNENKQAKNS